ncbi:hypothetical protein, conserved [Eimeria necatrix]|uniref:Uncharacterized protein n=1 Tax=Eimeria necatrix TaxID=51315 RepID=U6MYR1_9EIME|nr:hypothetical protein, conserved [Eimeria necatrix]CDJ67624.1 hypothetical protein, conserved [Eimeria necatrix]
MTGSAPPLVASSHAASESCGWPDEASEASTRRTAAKAAWPRSYPFVQLERKHPLAFTSVAAASAKCHLQLLQDPLWFASLAAARAVHRSGGGRAVCGEEVHLSAAAKEGAAVAAEIATAAAALGQGDPVLRLQAAALLGEAAAQLQSIGEKLSSSDSEQPATARSGPLRPSEDAQCSAAAAERAASALQLWHFRLMALPFSLSIVTLGARGAAPWRPRPCSGLSGVAATPLMQPPFGADELLLLQQHIQLAISFINTLAIRIPHKLEHLQLRCMHTLQQAQQLLLQLDLSAAMPAPETASEAAEEPVGAALCPDASIADVLPHTSSLLLGTQDRGVALPVVPARATPAAMSKMLVAFLRWKHPICDWFLKCYLQNNHEFTISVICCRVGGVALLAFAVSLVRAFGVTPGLQRRQKEEKHSWLNPSVQPLVPRLWTFTLLGKQKNMRETALSRGFFLPTVSPCWRGEFVGCPTGVRGGSAPEGSFLLKHAAKLHAFLTSSLRPELALR